MCFIVMSRIIFFISKREDLGRVGYGRTF